MGDTCSTYGENRKLIQNFRQRTFGEATHLGDLGVDEKIILKFILKKWNMLLTRVLWFKTGTNGGFL